MKEVVEYLSDSFIDFEGKEHKFVLCAVSRVNEDIELYFNNDNGFEEVVRTLTVGCSVCNLSDEFDEELGKKIAYGRTSLDKYVPDLVSTVPGVINTAVVKALLRQEADYIKRDPNHIIPGYNEKMKKVQRENTAKAQYAALTPEEKTVVNFLKNTPELMNEYANIAKNLPNS